MDVPPGLVVKDGYELVWQANSSQAQSIMLSSPKKHAASDTLPYPYPELSWEHKEMSDITRPILAASEYKSSAKWLQSLGTKNSRFYRQLQHT
ncbi:hypothetical protein A6R68_09336, partial [Neotoma lepida]